MPVDTDSGVWRAAEERTSTRAEILGFLRSNPDRAFSVGEIAAEVVGIDPEVDLEGLDPGADEAAVAAAVRRAIQVGALRAVLEGHLSALVYAGEVQVRDVPAGRLGTDAGEGTVPCYAVAD